ncbi:hypothetical protein RhiirA4_482355 [Rhizophagus irregularis]|uniref:Uncharacterized protein n=1 Tax=Rhizophagus irregularis TaxID=588596 RepID=A0A2I1HL22_9GLOM|nr:hypothetical protein RhiirA4_482355 [Rhizophagus irregularis]
MDTYSKNISQSNQKQGYDNDISILLDVSTMVSTVVRPFDCSADFNSFNQHYGNRHESSSASSEEPKMENVRLQNFRIRYQEKGFSEKAIKLLLALLDQNSTRLISSNFRVWFRWCESRNLDPITCNLNSICEFFDDKLKDGKVANTIARYRTVISEVHELVNGQSVGSHLNISKAILAVHRLNLPTVKQNDNLDISSSLEYILSLGDNNSMFFQQLTVKTAFLVALVTASRPSDIVRMDLTTLQATNNSYSFDCLLLCPFLMLKPYSPVAIDTIAGQISFSASTAKDVCTISASLAQNAGMDLSTVLALGNWTSNTTFQRFYQRGVRIMLERNNVSG